jgi:hypothetical protein
MKQIGTAMIMYAHDYDGHWPAQWFGNIQADNERACAVVENWSATLVPNWAAPLWSYTKSFPIFTCPSSAGRSPSSDLRIPGLNYAMNGWASGRPDGAVPSPSQYALLWDYRLQTSWAVADPSPNQYGNGICAWMNATMNPAHSADTQLKGQVWIPDDTELYNVFYHDGHAKHEHGGILYRAMSESAPGFNNIFFY